MIQKCPNCGQWCQVEASSALDRATLGTGEVATRWGDAGERLLGGLGLGKLGRLVGSAASSYIAIGGGVGNALFGSRYQFTCPNCGTEWETDNDEDDQSEQYYAEQKLFEGMESTLNKIQDYIDKNKYDEAIRYINSIIPQYPDYLVGRLYQELAYIYCLKEDWEKVVSVCSKGLDAMSNSPSAARYVLYYRYIAQSNLGNWFMARSDALIVARWSEEETLTVGNGEEELLKDRAENDFYSYNAEYRDVFLDIPYKNRKALMVVDNFTTLAQDHVDVFSINNLPDIEFPIGHPVSNELYIGHPKIPKVYYPLESYQLELIKQKLKEFCTVAQCLGATEITIDCLNSNKTDKSRKWNGSAGGSGSSDYGVEGNVNYRAEGHSELIEELSHSISLHQTFRPSKQPYIPDGLVWYPTEPSWQELYSQRINGDLLTHEERIETKKSQMVSGQELKAIKGEVETLFNEMSLELEQSDEQKFEQHENAILSINVKFASITTLQGNARFGSSSSSPSKSVIFNDAEKEYLEEVKFTLEDGVIGPRERKTLERMRIKLGISEARAAEIEASISAPQLSDAEKEYLEEVNAMKEDGEIGVRERKTLERVRMRLGISEDRAKEIEQL